MLVFIIIVLVVALIIFIAALAQPDTRNRSARRRNYGNSSYGSSSTYGSGSSSYGSSSSYGGSGSSSSYRGSSSSSSYRSSYSRTSYDRPAECAPDYDSLTVVGGFYRDWEERDYIEELQPNDEVFFLEEPDNEYDKNAVMVISVTGLHLGYVPRTMARAFKARLMTNKLQGLVLDYPDNYQFKVKVSEVYDIVTYNQAVSGYLERKEASIRETLDLQKYKFYSELISLAVGKYKRKQYALIPNVLKPMIEGVAKGYDFFRLMILTYHCLADYKNESVYLDKILSLENVKDKEFFERRKYHVLRVLGLITSNDQIENVKPGVETTVLELDFFHRIVTVLSDVVDPNRIDYRDSKGLFAVNLDGNIRKPICKLYLNNPEKMFIGLMNEDGSVLKIAINSMDELDGIKDELVAPIKKFMNDSPLFV